MRIRFGFILACCFCMATFLNNAIAQELPAQFSFNSEVRLAFEDYASRGDYKVFMVVFYHGWAYAYNGREQTYEAALKKATAACRGVSARDCKVLAVGDTVVWGMSESEKQQVIANYRGKVIANYNYSGNTSDAGNWLDRIMRASGKVRRGSATATDLNLVCTQYGKVVYSSPEIENSFLGQCVMFLEQAGMKATERGLICPPEKHRQWGEPSTAENLRQVWLRYAKRNESKLTGLADSSAFSAFQETWPCDN